MEVIHMTQERRRRTGSEEPDSSQTTNNTNNRTTEELLSSLGEGLIDLSRHPMSWGSRKARGIQRLLDQMDEEAPE
jgi:hypothetical protein